MIARTDLIDAINVCQSEKNPDANTCIKLAAYYTILNAMNESDKGMSFAQQPAPPDTRIHFESDSEFAEVLQGKEMNSVLDVLDELMIAVHAINPRLYNATLRKLRDI